MYSIGQVAEMFGLPISTLRYYDKQGLFPNMERVSGIRKFGDTEIEEIAQMNRTLDMLKFKCWYYEQAIRDGNEEKLAAMIPDELPDDIRAIYDSSHKK